MRQQDEMTLTRRHFSALLGVDVDASADEVDAAWRDWQQSNSPDAIRRDGGSDAEIAEASKRASDVNRARQVLKGERPLKAQDSLKGDWDLDVETEVPEDVRNRDNTEDENDADQSDGNNSSGFTNGTSDRTRDRTETVADDETTDTNVNQTEQHPESGFTDDLIGDEGPITVVLVVAFGAMGFLMLSGLYVEVIRELFNPYLAGEEKVISLVVLVASLGVAAKFPKKAGVFFSINAVIWTVTTVGDLLLSSDPWPIAESALVLTLIWGPLATLAYHHGWSVEQLSIPDW